MGIKEFKEKTKKEDLRCTFCRSKEPLEVIEHEYEFGGAMLKFVYFCKACNFTVSGHIY